MYSKLAWRNVWRSLHDYGIYFLTLVFSVSIFYVFNTLDDQPAFLALHESSRRLAQSAVQIMEWLTVVMTGVVVLLIYFANRVIIRKRNQEFGIYLLLGMEQGHLALLLVYETILIGIAALLIGLLSGVFLSQFFALIINRVLGTELATFPFVFSLTATRKTIVLYGAVFVLLGCWQATDVYRKKLIDLITGSKRNEVMRLRNRALSFGLGLISVVALAFSYYLADQVSRDAGLRPQDPRILVGCLIGLVATYMLFASLAGILTGIRAYRGWMLRGLNIFLYRQMTSKINSHAAMLATITLMVTIALCAMSAGLGLGQGIGKRADEEAPFDYMFLSGSPTADFSELLDVFERYGVTDFKKVRFTDAATDMKNTSLMLPDDAGYFEQLNHRYFTEVQIKVIPSSSYSKLRALKNYEPVDIPSDRYLVHTAAPRGELEKSMLEAFQRFLKAGEPVTLAGRTLKPAYSRVFTEPLGYISGPYATLVVPDSVAQDLPVAFRYMAIQLDKSVKAPAELDETLTKIVLGSMTDNPGNHYNGIIRAERVGSAFMMEGMLVFLSFYLGIMFFLISAALLALHQISDFVEHRLRFEVLRILGADDLMIDLTIVRQIGLYFLTPVVLALLHTGVAMVSLDRLFKISAGYTTVWPATMVTASTFAAVYVIYYYLTLQSCRSLFKRPQTR